MVAFLDQGELAYFITTPVASSVGGGAIYNLRAHLSAAKHQFMYVFYYQSVLC